MTETGTIYDPIPALAMLLGAAQRLADGFEATGGVTTFARQLAEALNLPELATAEEAAAALRKALAGRQVDLTGPGGFAYAEILTPAGIVRVNVNLADTQTSAPVVVVEVEPNTLYGAKTSTGGDWDTEVRQNLPGFRTDIRLARRGS